MDKKALNVAICAVLSVLLEMPDYWSPRTPVYLALGADMDKFNTVETIMKGAKLIETTSDTMTLTPLGVEFAQKVNALIVKK